jgi:hypothetical protein
MCTKRTFLGQVALFVPKNHPKWARGDKLSFPSGFFRIDQDNTIGTSSNGTVFVGRHAGGFLLAVKARNWDVSHQDPGKLSSFLFFDAHPEVALTGLSLRIGKKVISHIFVLAGNLTIVASVAAGEIDDHAIPNH